MNLVSDIFSFLCCQDGTRSFLIAAQQLPFCQRCTGVYVGMGISILYLLLSGRYRKGLPPKPVVYVNIASLLIMPIFGFHILDPGPGWRLWSGLIFGNAIAFLFLPAAWTIHNKGRASDSHSNGSVLWFLVLFAFLNTLPLWLPVQSGYCYYAVLGLTFAALLGVSFCTIAVMIFLMRTVFLLLLKGLNNECARYSQGR